MLLRPVEGQVLDVLMMLRTCWGPLHLTVATQPRMIVLCQLADSVACRNHLRNAKVTVRGLSWKGTFATGSGKKAGKAGGQDEKASEQVA